MSTSVKLQNWALDETPSGDIIVRGVVDPGSLRNLLVDDYQREILPLSSLSRLTKTLAAGTSVPDIELGMRGNRTIERGDGIFLQDQVFIIDGLQRVSAASQVLQQGGVPHLGAVVHFDTTKEWERDRFRILNADRTKLSSNVLLRNLREDFEVVELMHRLTTADPSFVLNGRVCWSQRQSRQEIMSAMTLAKTVGILHSHLGPTRYSRYDQLAQGLQTAMEATGKNIFRDNIRTFFEVMDTCWGIKRIAFKEGAVYIRSTFLLALAEVLMGHLDFWRDKRLFVEAPLVRKLAQFPVVDPTVQNLSSAAGKAKAMLVIMMVDHINSGKRTKRLQPRMSFDASLLDDVEEDERTAC